MDFLHNIESQLHEHEEEPPSVHDLLQLWKQQVAIVPTEYKASHYKML